MKRFLLYVAFITLGLCSCITQVRDFEQIGSNSFLTVEASLSNQAGPQRVIISFSSPSITINVENKPVNFAQVFITDDKGGRENLFEMGDGIYETSANYKGIVGNSYKLNIVLADGKKYQSTSEKMLAAPKIDKINTMFVVQNKFPLTDVRSMGHDVTLNFKDSPEPNQYYQWKWIHYSRTVYCASCERGYDYDLRKCSVGLDYPSGQSPPELINYLCNESCFDILYSSTYNILSDNLFNGQLITDYPIARVPFNGRSLYYLKIEQRAISKKMYEYFRSVKTVAQDAGTLFDVPAETQFSPNIFSVENPNEKILGAFEVFGSDEELIYIDRNDVAAQKYSPVRIVYRGMQIPSGPKAYCTEGKYRTKKEPNDFKE